MVSPLVGALLGQEASAQPQPASVTPAAPLSEPAGPQDPPLQKLPLAPQLKGSRPRSNPNVLPPAATVLPANLRLLQAPLPLALPNKPSQVSIQELRPLGLVDSLTLAEVNNPNLKALAVQVQEDQSALRAQISLWYPQITLRAGSFPTFTGGQQYSNRATGTGQEVGLTLSNIWRMTADVEASWALISPGRNPQIAAARDQFEKAKNNYLIGLRDLRLQVSTAYFNLQQADEQVRIGQESVRSSQVSLRDARARFQAGVATKLEVLQAETQLARDQQLLTNALYGAVSSQPGQSIARRTLAALLSLPQDITPTAKDPSRVIGTWLPTLQESIVAAYAFREELDQLILDISVANSNANAELAKVQPLLNIVNTLSGGRTSGYEFIDQNQAVPNQLSWRVDNTIGLNVRWNLFDGGGSQALYRRQKQIAEEKRFRFADRRNVIREEVERSFYELEANNRNITTTSREVLSARESLRLARLRFQAGVTTQREVVDTQRDLTNAEVRYSNAIADYNKGLASLQRRTGLDQISICPAPSLPPNKPVVAGATDVPVEVQPLVPACQAKFRPSQAPSPSLAP